MYRVYKHTCPNNSVYVGVTNLPYDCQRFARGAGYDRQKFYDAIMEYGWDSIKHEQMLITEDKAEALDKERELIVQAIKSGYKVWNVYKCAIPDHKSEFYVDIDTGETYKSFAEIGRAFNISRQSARQCILSGYKVAGHTIVSKERYNGEEKE